MNIRGINSGYSAASTQTLAAQKGSSYNEGALFVGGQGAVAITNKTVGFQCAGGDASLFVVNQGSGAKIQLGTAAGVGYQVNEDLGLAYKNAVISIGSSSLINGSGDADVIFSLGQSCTINTRGGNDYIFADGANTKVNGSDDSEYFSGVTKGLPSFEKLQAMNPYKLLETIFNKNVASIYKAYGV